MVSTKSFLNVLSALKIKENITVRGSITNPIFCTVKENDIILQLKQIKHRRRKQIMYGSFVSSSFLS